MNMNWLMMCKIRKKCNKIKRHCITCSHIGHVNILKYVYWLDTHFVEVWRRYVLQNANTVHFCDFFRHRAVLPTVSKIKNPLFFFESLIFISRILAFFRKFYYFFESFIIFFSKKLIFFSIFLFISRGFPFFSEVWFFYFEGFALFFGGCIIFDFIDFIFRRN